MHQVGIQIRNIKLFRGDGRVGHRGEVKKNNLSENIVKEFHFLIKNRFVSRMNVCTYFAIFMFVSNSSLSGIPKSKRSNF